MKTMPAQIKMTPRDLYICWRICREIRKGEASLDTIFSAHFPGHSPEDIENFEIIGQSANLFLANPLRLTEQGVCLSNATTARSWVPTFPAGIDLSALINFFVAPAPRPKIVDLFAGAGGLGLGFEMAGFEVVAAVENDPQAAAAHRLNFPNAHVFEEDIVPLAKNFKKVLSQIGIQSDEISGVIGGPPCQGFSFMGERSSNDERNLLTSRFVDIVESIKPKFFVMENVPGLFSSGVSPDLLTFLIRQSKLAAEPASNIVELLPQVHSSVAKRSRQFLRRLVSGAIEEARNGVVSRTEVLPTAEKHLWLESQVAILRAEFTRILLDHSTPHFTNNESDLRSALANCEKEIEIITLGMLLEKLALSDKNFKHSVREVLESLTRSSKQFSATFELLGTYDSIPAGGVYGEVKLGPIALHLIERLSKNYDVAKPAVFNAAEFGAPQDRRRAFIIGIRRDVKADYVLPRQLFNSTRSKTKIPLLPTSPSSSDVLADIPDADVFDELLANDKIPNSNLGLPTSELARQQRYEKVDEHDFSLPRADWNPFQLDCAKRTIHTAEAKDRISKTPLGKQEGTSGRTRLHPNLGSHTLRAGTREGKGSHTAVRPLHYAHSRVITVREGARLMGFPDWMTFHETKWHGFRLVGNGVPAQLGWAVASSIIAVIENPELAT